MMTRVLGLVLLAVSADAGGGCETAWARHDDEMSRICFTTLGLGNWGWTNSITGTVTLPVYSAAGQCDITKGYHSADLEVSYEPGTGIRVTWVPKPGVTITEYQLYIGDDKLPKKKNGGYTAAPGKLGVVVGDATPLWHLFDMPSVMHGDGFYLAAHAVTCGTPTPPSSTPSPTCPPGPHVEIDSAEINGVPLGGSVTYDDGRVELWSIPEYIRDMAVHAPTGDVAGDTIIKLTCCGDEVCEFVFTHYHCPPCSGPVNGGFPSVLPQLGFAPARCSPKWGATKEKMVSYRRQLEAGEVVEVTTSLLATSFVVFSQTGALSDMWCPVPAVPWQGPSAPQQCIC